MLNQLKTAKGVATLGIAVVFAIAVYGSALHIYHVARHYGQPWYLAGPLPAMIDIFALFCAIKLRSPHTSKVQRILNRVGMWSMLTLSLWFNIESALITNVTLTGLDLGKAVVISAVPAAVVALAAEILTHVRKAPGKAPSKTPGKAPSKAAEPTKATATTKSTPRKSIKSTATTEPVPAPAA